MWMRPLLEDVRQRLCSLSKRGRAFWELLGHGSHGDVYPGEEPGPQMRPGDTRNPNSRSYKQQQQLEETQPNTGFGLTISKYFALAVSEKCILHKHLPEVSAS